MDNITKLQEEARALGCLDWKTLSEFELHSYIKKNNTTEHVETPPLKANNGDINIFNVLQIFNAPNGIEEQHEMVRRMFDVQFYHIHNDETGEYFLVRHTIIREDSQVQAIKLDPAIPSHAEIMNDVLSIVIEDGLINTGSPLPESTL